MFPRVNRRAMLRSCTGATLAAAWPGCARQPRRHLDRIGLQLYTVRAEMARDVEGTLARVAEIGYREVEFWTYFGQSPTAIRAALANTGLTAPAVHVPYETLADGWDEVLATATEIGIGTAVIAWIPPQERTDIAAWEQLARRFNTAGGRARAAGLRFAYHNHDVELAPLAERIPYDVLLAETDPALVDFEMDLYWITKGGGDPLAYFAAHPGRFPLVHVKDSAGAPEHRMVDLGRGTIDFAQIFAHGRQAGTRHWFVEHDEPADAFTFCRGAFAYLRRLAF